MPIKIGGNEDGRGAGERLQVDPNMGSLLFMGTTKDGLWKSTDHGKSWSKIESFHPANINFVLFDPASSTAGNATRRIFAATVTTNGESLYRTDDGGMSWNVVPGQPNGVMGIRGCIANSILFISTANHQGPNGATAGSVWRYNISLGGWKNISPSSGSFGFSGISVYKDNPNIITVSTLDSWKPQDEIYLSTDGGATWRPRLINALLDHRFAPYTKGGIKPHWLAALSMDPFDSSRVIFGTVYGIWATDNFTSSTPTWYFKDQNLEETVPIQIVSSPQWHLFSAMGDIDGFRHDTLDRSPVDRYFPYKGTTLAIAYAGKNPSMLVKAFHSSPFGAYSTDGGSIWKDFKSFPAHAKGGGACSIVISADGKTIVWCPPGSFLSYSEDNGTTWKNCSGGVPLVSPVADRINPDKLYAYDGAKGQLLISTDRAHSFHKAAGGLPVWSEWSQLDATVAAVPEHDGDIWICCADGGLFHSSDSGFHAIRNQSVTAAYHMGFGKSKNDNDYPAIYLYGIMNGKMGFFRSDNAGQTWIRINDDHHQFGWIHQITGDPKVYGRCYVSAEGRGIMFGQPENK
ncbi:MAG: endoglucanase [Bacteroidota bacterium]